MLHSDLFKLLLSLKHFFVLLCTGNKAVYFVSKVLQEWEIRQYNINIIINSVTLCLPEISQDVILFEHFLKNSVCEL